VEKQKSGKAEKWKNGEVEKWKSGKMARSSLFTPFLSRMFACTALSLSLCFLPSLAFDLSFRTTPVDDVDCGGAVLATYLDSGYVCSEGFDNVDADAICRAVGYAESIGADSTSALSTPTYMLTDLDCSRHPDDASLCRARRSSECNTNRTAVARCLCLDSAYAEGFSSISLQGGGGEEPCQGRIEGSMSGRRSERYGVCSSGFSSSTATKICQILGYSGYSRYSTSYNLPMGRGDVVGYVKNLECDVSAGSCISEEAPDCSYPASVECSGCDSLAKADVRLTGGWTPCEGDIQVKLFGQWGYICGDSFDMEDANVACRQAGYLGAATVPYDPIFSEDPTSSGLGNEYMMNGLKCGGNETGLVECPFTAMSCSSEAGPARVVCYGSEECSGRLRSAFYLIPSYGVVMLGVFGAVVVLGSLCMAYQCKRRRRCRR